MTRLDDGFDGTKNLRPFLNWLEGLRHPGPRIVTLAVSLGVGLLAGAGCTSGETNQTTYFDRTISPITTSSCVRTNTGAGCHVADAKGNAFGNLDVSTFAGFNKRRDLFDNYGPYGQPSFLLKNVPPYTVTVQGFDGNTEDVQTDIKHAGGPILDPTGSGYQVLRRYLDNGATENNTGTPPAAITRLPCTSAPPSTAGLDTDPTTPDFAQFKNSVVPVIMSTCAAGNCHGTPVNELFLTCGDTPEGIRWNYQQASDYLAQKPEASELVRRPLDPSQGGSYHEGGVIFSSVNDPSYQALLTWATAHGPPVFGTQDPNFLFFADRVQPMLVKKGCMMLQCHSAAMFHDYRLRGGSGGSFSYLATQRNYTLSLLEMSLESQDVTASRLVQKNLYRPEVFDGAHGLAHRGGSLLEDFSDQPASGALCDAASPAYDYDNGVLDQIPAFCVIREWHRRERLARNLVPMSAVVYVSRSIGDPSTATTGERPQDFDVYTPGADLHVAQVTTDAEDTPTAGADTSITSKCGLDPSTADIRRPAVSWDGTQIAFAARTSAATPLQIYTSGIDGTGCAPHPLNSTSLPANTNGLLVHNFDPAWSPPDSTGAVHLLFASTRGNILSPSPFDYDGPQRTPADPSKPNANLYVYEPNPANPAQNQVRQLTSLLDMERYPTFMTDGRFIFTTEKREPGFYQLALRRMNLDSGDYHPLYAQRSSIGDHEATSPVELSNRNFAALFRDPGTAHGGGTIAVFNRSLGIDFASTDPKDYLVDPSVIDPNAPASPEPSFFLHSLSMPDTAASGVPGASVAGVYYSPSAIPGAKMLVSYGAASDPATFGGDYDVYVLDPSTGTKTKLLGAAGTSEVDAVGVYPRAVRAIFTSALDEPNGFTQIHPNAPEADINVLSVPLLASLLFQNTPTGRLLDNGISSVDVYEELPPTSDVTSYASGGSNVATDDFGQVYVRRRSLGTTKVSSDGSAHFSIPGGVPIVLHLPDTDLSRKNNLPRWQLEEMEFSPGEYNHQSFQPNFFNGLCGGCHNSTTGKNVDFAVQPDLLTQASQTISRGTLPDDLDVPPSARGAVQGPPTSP